MNLPSELNLASSEGLLGLDIQDGALPWLALGTVGGASLVLSTGAATLFLCGLGFLWYGSRSLLGSVSQETRRSRGSCNPSDLASEIPEHCFCYILNVKGGTAASEAKRAIVEGN